MSEGPSLMRRMLRNPRMKFRLIGFVVLSFVAWQLIVFAWPGKWTYSIGPETTRITDHCYENGRPNYVLALNEKLAEGVEPQKNANVILLQVLGPEPEGAPMPHGYFERMGVTAPPKNGRYFVDQSRFYTQFIEPQLNGDTKQNGPAGIARPMVESPVAAGGIGNPSLQEWYDLVDRLQRRPWSREEHPDVELWLRRNERPLTLLAEIEHCPQFYNPLLNRDGAEAPGMLVATLLPSVQKCRSLAPALVCRAMMRLGEGNADAAWDDLMLCERLGRTIMKGSTLIEFLVGAAVMIAAMDGEAAFLNDPTVPGSRLSIYAEQRHALPPIASIGSRIDLGERYMALDIIGVVSTQGEGVLSRLDGPDFAISSNNSAGGAFTSSIDFDPAYRLVNTFFDRLVEIAAMPERDDRVRETNILMENVRIVQQQVGDTGLWNRYWMNKQERGEYIGKVVMGLVFPAFGRIMESVDRVHQRDALIDVLAALAVHRSEYCAYPESLQRLVPNCLPELPKDIYGNGQPRYRRIGDGFSLWTVGLNQKDDDGRTNRDDPVGDDIGYHNPLPSYGQSLMGNRMRRATDSTSTRNMPIATPPAPAATR